MHLLGVVFVISCAFCLCFAKPYQYSYYVSMPGHYQTLAVRDGELSTGVQQPSLIANPTYTRQLGYDPNRSFGNRYPFGDQPQQQYNPEFGRRGGNSGGYDSPSSSSLDNPNGELDPLFSRWDSYPRNRGRQFSYYPYSAYDSRSRFDQERPQYPAQNGFAGYNSRYEEDIEFGRGSSPARRTKEVDESDKDDEKDEEEEDREATTPDPCSFCGVDKVNPKDANGKTNPDAEPVPSKGKNDPRILIANSAVSPATVVPGYPPGSGSPVVPYYVVV